MSDITQEITFGPGTGLDWDSDKRLVASGDSRYRLNVIANGMGSEFTLTNLLGNTVHSHGFTHNTDYAGATYQVIGDCYDDNRDAVYLFIFSNRGNDSILRFNFANNSFNRICWDHTGLGLDQDHPICDAFIIGDWLHFNPVSSSPRVINVQWAYYDFLSYEIGSGDNRTAGQYVKFLNKVYRATATVSGDTKPIAAMGSYEFIDYCYQDTFPINAVGIDAGVLGSAGEYLRTRNFFNIPTVIPYTLTASVGTDADYEYNNIRGRRFQFCYRHYIKDQGYTITSPFTGIIAPPSSETNKGEVVGDIGAYNKITISIPVSIASSVDPDWYERDTLFEFIEVLFREGPNDNWKIAEKIDHTTIGLNYSGYLYNIDFLNDRSYDVVDGVAVEKQYNPLPIKANSQWSLDGNRSAYGGVTEGFDNIIDIDVTLTVGEVAITLDEPPVTAAETTYTFSTAYDSESGLWIWTSIETIITPVVPSNGDALSVSVGGVQYTRTLQASDVDTEVHYADAMLHS